MRYLLFVVLNCLNFYLLFCFSKKFERSLLLKLFPALIPIVVILFFALGFVLKLSHGQMNFKTSQALISAMMSLIVISVINFINQFFSYMVDSIAGFHRKNNANNLGRQPVKFLIDHQTNLKVAASVIWFLGTALMLYGIWLADQP